MTESFFKCILLATVALSSVTPAATEPLYLLAQGRAEFEIEPAPSKILDDGVLVQLRNRLEVRWLQNRQILPTNSWKTREDYLLIDPVAEDDWSQLSLRITLPTNPEIIDNSFEVELEVYVQPVARTAFHGVQVVDQIKSKVWQESFYPDALDQLGKENHFVLKLNEMPPTDVVYNRAASLVEPQSNLTAEAALEVVEDLILIYRIDGNRYYLHELAKALKKYLAHAEALPWQDLEFLRQLYMHPKFAALSPTLQARHLHEIALQFHNAADTDSIVSESNGTTNRDFAMTLLNNIRLPEDQPQTEAYENDIQNALQLRLQVACGVSTAGCFREMLAAQQIDARHPIDERRMAIMLNRYTTELELISRHRVRNATSDEDFVARVAVNRKLAQLWTVFSCTLEQNDGRLALLEFDERFESVSRWAPAIRKKANLSC
ncbi:hypothetical protein K4K96_13475 [Phaeobacter inhibens]|uniref:hypothetical protein n=1 Tax=Phaeobacter inhibens TaxID=221822 RepID=UPI0021A863F7|nr:hypothetical protein [Phaeobacter inhibens]UWR91704.1 hypothetical protein K4K96_13475 [Phaeobacter inhibens]